jgi:drug/metabolite transporter (DMT)-like permease
MDKEASAHRRAIALMVAAATLWSIAGVVTRHLTPELQQHGRLEITFWRSFFAAAFVAGYMIFVQRAGLRPVFEAGRPGLISGLCWATMYSAFMLALTLTTTANTLVVMSVAPLVTALLARAVLGVVIAPRTWLAIGAAALGIAWMFSNGSVVEGRHVLGIAIAFAVPLASAINLVTLQKTRAQVDLIPAVFIGGSMSALLMLIAMGAAGSVTLRAAAGDVLLLASLGFFQLGLPCMLMIRAARHLSAPEIALLALLEVILGPLWAWLGAGETPTSQTLVGGAIVLAALVANELAPSRRAATAS